MILGDAIFVTPQLAPHIIIAISVGQLLRGIMGGAAIGTQEDLFLLRDALADRHRQD